MNLTIFLAVVGGVTLTLFFCYFLYILVLGTVTLLKTFRLKLDSLLMIESQVRNEKTRLKLKNKLEKVTKPKIKTDNKYKEKVKKETEEVKETIINDIED